MDCNATIINTKLSFMGGEREDAWLVSADEGDGTAIAVFMGYDASARATKYARANYTSVDYRMFAEPGHISSAAPEKQNGARA